MLRSPVRSLLAQREALLRRVAQAAAATGPARQTRVHGDLSLGQVLLARNDFIFIGFGGSSARAFTAGRSKAPPLRDVGCLLQSITRARLEALLRLGPPGEASPALRRLARAWEFQVRQTFLAAYDGTAPTPTLPLAATWLWLYEAEAALWHLEAALQQPAEELLTAVQALADLLTRSDPTS
jgi:maltose alpha-D-glucosyltransferase/alpha-amylase